MNVPQLAKALVSPRRGDLKQLRLTERGRTLVAWCPDDEIFTLSRELILDRIYESGAVKLRPGMGVVVDAGAHVGIFSLLASQWAQRVVALEASQINVALLALNVRRNALGNVEARHCALWGTSTQALEFSAAHHSGGGVVAAGSPTTNGTVAYVPAVSLDDLVGELGPIDLLKIDIEGAEYEVFGASKRLEAISQIVGEVHIERAGDRARLEALLGHLSAAGFSASLIKESELLSTARLDRLRRNASALKGYELVKAFAAAYYLAPIKKPIRRRGASYELPILIAHR